MKFTFIILFLEAITHYGFAIRITRFVVPTLATYGAIVNLDCAYDLENDQFYDVKWYKDNSEFFRCKSDGEVQRFPVEGIQLYHSERATLGSCLVSIITINSNSAGQYRCEVSTEGPAFKTAAKSGVLRISNSKPSKRVQDDNLTVTSTAPSSSAHQHNEAATHRKMCDVIELISIFVIYLIYNKSLSF